MTSVALFNFCGAAYLGLAILASTAWRRAAAGSGLAVALCVQALWSFVLAIERSGIALPGVLLVTLEITRSVCWAAVLVRGLTDVFDATLPRHWDRVLRIVAVGLPLLAALAPFWSSGVVLLTWLVDLQRWLGLLLAIGVLVLVEQFARNARADLRWELRYLWLGIGILFAYDLALWSLALLLGSASEALGNLRGAVNTFVAVLLGVSLRRLPGPIRSSLLKRDSALLFNTTLVMAGGYVLLMAGASLIGRPDDDAARSTVELLFLGAALVLLVAALFSSQFRAWWRVTLSKYFLPYHYNYRDVWLTLTTDLSVSTDVPVRRRVAMSLAAFANSGRGQIWEREDSLYRPADAAGATSLSGSVDHGEFFEFLRRREWIFDAMEWRRSGGQRGLSSDEICPTPPEGFLADPDLWLVVPLLCNDDIVGVALIGNSFTPTSLGWEQIDLLRAASRQIGSYLAFDRAAMRLAEMRQFEALNRLSAFIMHDLRHLVAQLALVVDNAARHRHNPEFIDDAILTIESSVKRMTGLMDVLKAGDVTVPDRRVDVGELLREILARGPARRPQPQLDIDDEPAEVMANRERLSQALEHLIRNAQDATPADGSVDIRVAREPQRCRIDIADTGCGMDEEFVRTRLFKPFESTKGAEGMGLGAHEARDIVRKIGGTLTVDSSPGRGTIFRISLPLAPAVSL
jgi:putative PEP-CTERM system histidine kinase